MLIDRFLRVCARVCVCESHNYLEVKIGKVYIFAAIAVLNCKSFKTDAKWLSNFDDLNFSSQRWLTCSFQRQVSIEEFFKN